jgi:hypothetical protein
MRIEQACWSERKEWEPGLAGQIGREADLVFLFGSTAVLKKGHLLEEVRSAYPQADLIGCSTAGEIFSTRVFDNTLTATAVDFQSSRVKGAKVSLAETGSSFQTGERLAGLLDHQDLVHVFVLSDGLAVNGSELVDGLLKHLPGNIAVTGGLSGDGEKFEETLVLWNGPPQSDTVVGLGFYGNRLKIGYGSLGGWDPFGPERLITRSTGNVLYELDGKSALELYKKYLGDQAMGLPASGLLYPLSVRLKEQEPGLVRTILSVDEASQSMTFAGDVPEGAYARLMKANFNRLIDGAAGAAKSCLESLRSPGTQLAILISCVGRKMVLKQRIEEEVEAVREVLGTEACLTGFYSYGEMAPFGPGNKCELHNQTMTITTLTER